MLTIKYFMLIKCMNATRFGNSIKAGQMTCLSARCVGWARLPTVSTALTVKALKATPTKMDTYGSGEKLALWIMGLSNQIAS